MNIDELKSILDLCKERGVVRVKWKGVEVEMAPSFPVPIPQQMTYNKTLKELLKDPDLEMPEDMLGWSSPLTVKEETKEVQNS